MSNNLFSKDAQAQLKALKKQLETKTSEPNADQKLDQPVNLPSQKNIDKQVREHLKKLTGKNDHQSAKGASQNNVSFSESQSVGQDIDTDALADELLFKQAMSGVVPLKDKNTITPTELSAQKNKSQQRQDATALAKRAAAQGAEEVASDLPISDMQAMLNPVAAEAYLMYKTTGVQHRVFSQLKDGKLRWFEAVDIHGSTIEEARAAVLKVIQMAQENGHTVLKIVHGKAIAQKTAQDKQAVLKTCVNGWLRQHPDVLAFCSATPKDGGTGAVVVLIKATQPSTQK